MKTLLVALTMGVALGSAMVTCGESAAATTPLAGSGWQLTSIESPAGPTTVDDPAAFTVAFDADGRAAFRLDCNRGGSSWQATAETPDSGTLSFGPIAVTRMMCPQPSLDDRVAAALADVGGWRIDDGRLAMTPATGDTILHWAPPA
ncbi:MAG: META domain-containing protein [Mycobacterium sp.]|nr:META domain-containing protein [Mycobacterium sp.]